MYFIRAGDSLLYDPRVDGLKVTSPKLDLECNKAGTASFIMYPAHPLYDAVIKLKTIITIYRDKELIFRGRVLNDDIDFNRAKKLSLEGELAFFNDSVVRPYTFTGSIKDYLELLLDSHNSQVDAEKQFKLGNVTVTDPNDYIPRSDTTYPTTWSLLDSKLVGSLGGYLIVRHEDNGNYLDYLADSSYIAEQSIELGDNLLDLTRVNKGEDIATGIIPLGKAVDDDDPDTTDMRLTIASVNGGKDYLVDETAAAIYGRVFKTVTYNDVTIAANLLSKGKQDLAQSIKTLQTITIKAIDKYMTNVDITAFRVFEYVKVTSKPHGIEQNFLITKLSIDLENPKNNTMTTGADVSSFINKQSNNVKTLQEIKANYVKGEQVKMISNEVSGTVKGLARVEQKIETLIPQPHDKTLGAMGDSITNALTINKPYRMWAAEKLNYLNSINYGISSTRVTKPDANGESMATRWEKLPDTLDAAVVMAGVNDYAMNNGVPLGDFDSRDNTTFYGACHQMVKGLSLKFVGKPLLVVPPIMAARQDKPNQYGFILEDYAQALAKVCKYYSVPTLDLRHTSGVNPNVDQSIIDGWTRGGDGVHPNEKYHELLGKRIGNAMLQLI